MTGYRLSTDRADMQVTAIHDYLKHSYWSPGIPRETLVRAIANSLCAGAFAPDGAQHGFARVVTDCATFAYLADVFVLPSARGHGLATLMLRHLDALPELTGLRRWLLTTRDAHRLYEGLGWTRVVDSSPLMQRVDPDVYRRPPA